MKNLFLLLILLAVSGITFARLKLDNQGKTILGNYDPALRLDCRGEAVFSRWSADWCKVHIDWNNIYGSAQIYSISYNFTIGTSNYYVGAGYFRYMQLQNSPVINSDARLKENIHPIESALDKLMLVNGKSFNYIDDFDADFKINPLRERCVRPTYGFIAQELREVLPEIVNEPDELNEYYSVDYIAMIPLLVEAIKEQQNQIVELRKQIEILSKEKAKRRK